MRLQAALSGDLDQMLADEVRIAEQAVTLSIREATNGLKNERGTIAMARTNVPDSATSQFFINVVDNAMLNATGPGNGYAVFGKVTAGMDVVDKIRAVPTGSRGMHRDVPTTPVTILKASLEK